MLSLFMVASPFAFVPFCLLKGYAAFFTFSTPSYCTSLKLITPLKPEEPVGGKFQERGKAKDLLNEFNRLIEAANQRCSDANSRSVEATENPVAGAGQNF